MSETKPKYYNQSRNKASQKYQENNLEQVRFWVRKGERAVLQAAASDAGQSMAQYIVQAINERAGGQLLSPSGQQE